MPRKKKKNSDFTKIKIKAGKRLPKHLNETKPELKAKRIRLNPSFDNIDPVKLLSNPSLPTNRKLVYLTKANQHCSEDELLFKAGEKMQIICKYLTDNDHRVRQEAIKYLKNYFKKINSLKDESNEIVSPTLTIILIFVSCGITHINANIREDCQKLLSFIIEHSDSSMDSQLMSVFMNKINSSSFQSLDCEYYRLLKQYITILIKRISNDTNTFDNKALEATKPLELVWKENDWNFLDLNQNNTLDKIFSKVSDFNLTFQNPSQTSIGEKYEKFMNMVKKIILNDVESIVGKGIGRVIYLAEGIKVINALEIISNLNLNKELVNFWENSTVPYITVMRQVTNNKKTKRELVNTENDINRLLNKYRI